MKLGLHISNFTWDGGPARLTSTLTELAKLERAIEEVFDEQQVKPVTVDELMQTVLNMT